MFCAYGHKVFWAEVDGCVHGLWNPSGHRLKKTWLIMSNDEELHQPCHRPGEHEVLSLSVVVCPRPSGRSIAHPAHSDRTKRWKQKCGALLGILAKGLTCTQVISRSLGLRDQRPKTIKDKNDDGLE